MNSSQRHVSFGITSSKNVKRRSEDCDEERTYEAKPVREAVRSQSEVQRKQTQISANH